MIIELKNWCLKIWTQLAIKKTGNVGEILCASKDGKYEWRKP